MPLTVSPHPFEPVTLEGRRVRLEALELATHLEGLLEIGLDPELWRWTLNRPETREALLEYLETALREQSEARSLPFATLDRESGRIAGCTRFGNIVRRDRKVEIGWTWVGRAF